MDKKRNPNGSGSVFYDKSRDRWRSQIQWTDKSGQRHTKKFVGTKKSEVKNRLDEFRRQLMMSNGNISNGSVSFQEFADNWLVSSLQNRLKPTSYTRKEVTLVNQVYPYLGGIPVEQITHEDVQNMVNSLQEEGLSYSTIKKAYEAVNGCIREYRIKKAIPFNPCEGVSLPINKQRAVSDIVFYNEEQRSLIKREAVRVYKNGRPVYRLGHSIVVLMYTGMRIGELLALRWSDIDFDGRAVTISKNAVVSKVKQGDSSHYRIINQSSTKTKSGRRIIPLSETAITSLQEIFKITGNNEFVMSTSTGKQVTPRNINRLFHSILIKTGIADSTESLCGVHTLRHTFASMLFMNGCETKIVSELLGHADTKITENIYIHLIQQQKIKAIQDIDKYSDR